MSSDSSLRMNEDPQMFHDNNGVTTRDAKICLEQYAHKFVWKNKNIKIIDIGSGDGRVTDILKQFIPDDYEFLIGCDLSPKMVKFANDRYKNERTKFITLDIAADLPDSLKNNFDNVFSFYTIHWIKTQEKAFANVYKLLTKGGICFIVLLAYSQLYSIYLTLSKSDKWSVYLENVNEIISPYHDIQDPDRKVIGITEKVGFQNADVRCKQKIYIFENLQKFKNIIAAIDPFKIPEDKIEDFLNDYLKVARDMRMIDETHNTVKMYYNLIVIYCSK